MRVRMKTHITGYRDGVEWPPKGGIVDVPDSEVADLIANGYAEEAPDETAPEDPGAGPAEAAGPDGTPAGPAGSEAAGEPLEGSEAGAAPPPEGGPVDELDALRADYVTATGSKPDSRWRENRLRKEIAAARATGDEAASRNW